MRGIFVTYLLCAVIAMGFSSCAALEGFFGEGTVFTTADQLAEGEEGAVVPYDQLPESIKDKIPEGTEVVMANKEQLKDNAAFIPAGGDLDGNALGGIIDAGFGIAATFVPALAAWEGVVTLFSQRKRKHYGKAIKAIVPTDKNMDFGGALKGLAAAIGASHSSVASAEAVALEEAQEKEEKVGKA